MKTPVRILIADDHLLFRQGLKALLKQEAVIEIAAETDRVEAVPELLARTPCDLLLLDLQMERNTLADIEALSQKIPVVVLTASEVVAEAVTAIRMGARAVVFKRFAVETLMDAIRTVAEGNVWMPASLQTHMVTRLRNPDANLLSAREEEVVRYVVLGLRNAEVAQKLSISEQTVKTHLNSIFRKLKIRDRVELVLYAAKVAAKS